MSSGLMWGKVGSVEDQVRLDVESKWASIVADQAGIE